MFIVTILRWLLGYMDFEVEGKFPERFLNLATRKGINLWGLKSNGEGFSARAKISDYNDMNFISKKTQTTIHINKKHGLPILIEKYKHRMGIVVGAVLFFIICKYLSGFIWNIQINVPDTINEYDIRSELEELGLYEGVKNENIDINKIERIITINNPEISWITINIMGTDATVEISPNLSMNIDENDNHDNENTASNLKATADGTITRIEVKNGTSMVKVGEGVIKNQLLVSGVIEYSNGSSILVDSNAQIYANVSKNVEIEVPLNLLMAEKSDNSVTKCDINILGVKIPLTVTSNPDNTYIKYTSENRISLFGSKIPVTICSEKWYEYIVSEKKLSEAKAKEIANNRAKLYEAFLLYSSNKGQFMQKNYETKVYDDKIVLSANYIIEEDICTKSIIQVSD